MFIIKTSALLCAFHAHLQDHVQQSHGQHQDMALKPNTHVRLFNLPYSLDPEASLLNPAICNLGSFHMGKLVTVRGTVVKAGPVKMFESQKVYLCNKCKHRCVLGVCVCVCVPVALVDQLHMQNDSCHV